MGSSLHSLAIFFYFFLGFNWVFLIVLDDWQPPQIFPFFAYSHQSSVGDVSLNFLDTNSTISSLVKPSPLFVTIYHLILRTGKPLKNFEKFLKKWSVLIQIRLYLSF